jgi:hypothetical protein
LPENRYIIAIMDFRESKDSLPSSQMAAFGPYPGLDESSPYPTLATYENEYFLDLRFITEICKE